MLPRSLFPHPSFFGVLGHLLLQDLGIEESLERLDGCGTVLVLLCNRRGTADYPPCPAH